MFILFFIVLFTFQHPAGAEEIIDVSTIKGEDLFDHFFKISEATPPSEFSTTTVTTPIIPEPTPTTLDTAETEVNYNMALLEFVRFSLLGNTTTESTTTSSSILPKVVVSKDETPGDSIPQLHLPMSTAMPTNTFTTKTPLTTTTDNITFKLPSEKAILVFSLFVTFIIISYLTIFPCLLGFYARFKQNMGIPEEHLYILV